MIIMIIMQTLLFHFVDCQLDHDQDDTDLFGLHLSTQSLSLSGENRQPDPCQPDPCQPEACLSNPLRYVSFNVKGPNGPQAISPRARAYLMFLQHPGQLDVQVHPLNMSPISGKPFTCLQIFSQPPQGGSVRQLDVQVHPSSMSQGLLPPARPPMINDYHANIFILFC